MTATAQRGRKTKRLDVDDSAPKQQYIDGTEPVRVKEIEEAADTYRDIRDRRQELTREETAANEALLALMKEHGLTSYRYDGSEVTLAKEKEKARVRRIKAEGESE